MKLEEKEKSETITGVKSYLRKGNQELLSKNYEQALISFEMAIKQIPALQKMLQFNINYAKSKIKNHPISKIDNIKIANKPVSNKVSKRKLPLTVLVITWDIGHNPLGRSYMLAEALDRVVQNVVLTGFQFERYGNAVWEPVRNGNIPIIPLKGQLFPDLSLQFDNIVQKFKPDVVIACKPRLPSVQLGAMFKEKYNIPLIIDIDDHELSFVKDRTELTVDKLVKLDRELIQKSNEPYCELWTRLANDLVKYADARIVSNVALHREFGGEIIPHVRDELLFNPSLYDKNKQRQKYGIPLDAKVVMFFGTPRHHKGVGVLAEAIGKINKSNYFLVVVGTAPDKSVTNKLAELSKGQLINLPNQPFSSIPEIIVMADIICLPQDETHETSKYQLPAKAIDAVAMGIPLLVSRTEPLMELVSDGVAEVINTADLHNIILQQTNISISSVDIEKRRNKFLAKYSYAAAGEQLRNLIEKLLAKKHQLTKCTDLNKLIDFQHESFNVIRPLPKLYGKDIVVFWKQNDTGLYGRRHDMIIKYLASRDDVRKVIVIDAPISEYDLLQKRNGHGLTQDRSIYVKTYEKLLSQLDSKKVSYNVFVHKPGIYTYGKPEQDRKPIFEGYSFFLEMTFKKLDVDTTKAIFWFYPKNYLSNDILDFFKPEKIVVDVVDDHRAWPGVTEEEKEKLTLHYSYLLSKADFAFANCEPVIDSMKCFNPKIKLIPNGCEDIPEIIEPISNPLYLELQSFQGNVIGFVGNLESKIDITLIEKIAESFSSSLVLLIGSTHANPKVKELLRFKNIRMFGVVEYKYVNAIVSKFTVGIIPHLKTDMTKNMNPLKVFVYATNKIPVVCTNVDNIADADFVFKCGSHEDFISSLRLITSKDFEFKTDVFSDFILRNTWSSRLSHSLDLIMSEAVC